MRELITTRKLMGRLQFEIAEKLLQKRNIPYRQVTTILRLNLTADPNQAWIEFYYDCTDPEGSKAYGVATLEEWCSF